MADDQELWAQMGMPMNFGKQAKKKSIPRNFEQTKRSEANIPTIGSSTEDPGEEITSSAGPSGAHTVDVDMSTSTTQNTLGVAKDDGDGGEDSDFAEEEPEFDSGESLPITHEVLLKDHSKVVSALALDPSGARIVSGSHDYDCKLWDFGGMGGGVGEAKPFKTWEPAGTYYVHDLKFNPAGDQFLVVSGTLEPKLYDREGNETGHVGELTGCAWHPRDANTFITSSIDSTIRIWDVEDKRKQKTVIVVKSKERGTRTKVTSCAYSHDGKLIAGACLDGTLNLWPTSSNFVRPSHTVYDAHAKGTETGSVVFSVDGRTVLTRGNDDFAKLWDVRSFKKPIFTSPKIPTLYPETNAAFSPDEKFIVTGSAASKTEGGVGRGGLMFLRRDGLDVEKQVDFEVNETVVKVVWHSKINQILCGLSTGTIRLLYSPNTSTNGAKLLLNKHRKRATIESYSASLLQPNIITPHALPMFRDDTDRMTKRKRERERDDPKKTRKPMPPISGPGRGGRVGASATQHVVQNLVRDSTRDQDPREALLKYADMAEKDPKFTAAWRENQPNPVFREEEEEGET
ncbi:hypothetical protein FRB97_001381 [Tulasnella sp. 331]|nr:hypothetical protein FRB97_001381 [Tulasnella sp. 331]